MNKYDENYSVYFGTPSAEYPEGSAVDSTDEDKLDGTPLLAKFMNDVIGFMYAVFHGVYGNPKIPGQTVTRNISNKPDNATESDVWDAIKQFVTDKVATVSDALTAFKNTKGAANGIAPLDAGGKVAATYLPSYVDDVLEYANKASFPTSGEEGKIYIAKDTNKSYRWSGSSYIELSTYDTATQSASGLMSAADKTKLDGIAPGATKTDAPVNADWNATSGLAQILNKPTIPAAPVNADWNATSGLAQILNKPTIPAAPVNADWNATSGLAQILHKPTIPAAQVNADWNAASGVAQILNKPTIPAAQVNADWNAASGVAQILNKPTIPAAQVNSDWDAASGVAKILNKPTIPVIDSELSQTSTNGIQTKIATLNMNGVLCTTAAGTQVKAVDMPGFVLYAGATIKVLFQNACTVSYPQLKVGDTAAKKILAYRGGSPVDSNGLKASTGKWRGAASAFDEVWQAYTTLELMYDGTNWVIMGDPVIESYFTTDSGYEKKANGLIRQWGLSPAPSYEQKTNVTFYISYSNIPAISATTRGTRDSDYGESMLGQVIGTTSGFSCDTNNGVANKTRLYWMAIGY